MLRFTVLLLTLVLADEAFAQNFETRLAPREALGFAFGRPIEEVVKSLDAAGLVYRRDPVSPRTGVSKVILPNQVLGELKGFTVELSFAHEALYLVTATAPYSADAQKALLRVLTGKYGIVRSEDGGFHHFWFFTPDGRVRAATLPDFVISLANDAVTKKTIVLTYADNRVRGTGTAPLPDPDAASDLNPSQF